MPPPLNDVDRILTATADILMEGGYDAVTMPAIAERSGLDEASVAELFESPSEAMVAMLNREFSAMYASIVDHIERDPRGVRRIARAGRFVLTGERLGIEEVQPW